MKNNFFYKKQYSNIYKTTSRFSEVTSQILYGEKFKILSKNKSWIKVKSLFDNYVGYIKNENYIKNYKPTHKVYSLKTFIYSKPNNKTKSFLPFASKFSIINENLALSIFLKQLNIPLKKVAIELNLEIIDKNKINKIKLKQNDKIEIVHFIGGG